MATRNTVAGTLNWSAAYTLNRPSQNVAGNFQEPGLTNANWIMSTVLAPPFGWQWNRETASFTAAVNQSDYVVNLPFFGWLEKATVSFSGMTPPIVELPVVMNLTQTGTVARPSQICPIFDDNAGNITFRLLPIPDKNYTVTLTYQEAPNFLTSLYQPSIGAITSIAAANSVGNTVYTASGGVSGGASNGLVNQYIFISGATATVNNGLYLCLASDGFTVSLQNPNGVLQGGAGGTIQVANNWEPIPDKFNFLYENGMLALLRGMYDNAAYLAGMQLFYRMLVSCSEGLSDTAKSIFLEDRLTQLRTESTSAAANSATPRR